MSNYIIAESTDLYIGNFQFDAIRISQTNEYRMSQSQTLKAVGERVQWLSDVAKKKQKAYQTLTAKGFTWCRQTVKYHDGKQYRFADTLSLEDVRILWRYLDKSGNVNAEILIDLLSDDDLKDRFEQIYNSRRTTEERRADDNRILDYPEPWTLTFDEAFEKRLAYLTGLHKNDIRNAQYYWEFIYSWMTAEERCKLEEVNPVLPSGRRRYKIHQMLDFETKQRLTPHIQAVYLLMKVANSLPELRRLLQRHEGIDQPNLFDGWNVA